MKKGWELKKLGDVCYSKSSNVSQNQLADEIGKYPIFGASGLIKNISFYHRDKPYLSIVKDGSGYGRVTKMEAFTSVIGTLQYILPNDEIDLDYLNYSLMSVDFKKYVQGAAIPHIYFKDYKNEPFLWMPLPEQKRVVAILDKAFDAIANAKANAELNIKNANELFESYLQEVFENRGGDWVKVKLDKLLEDGWIISHLDGNHGGDYPKREEFISDGVPYISANCLKGTNIDFTLAKFLSPTKAATFRKGVAINNDVLFAHNATVGPVALLQTDEEKVILGTSLTYYRCNTQYILPEYLANYMRSKEFKLQYEIVMRQSTRNQVPITKQREFYHIIPPIEFQKEIIIKLEQLLEQTQKLEMIYQAKINNLEELKKSLLQKAFNGELKTNAVEV